MSMVGKSLRVAVSLGWGGTNTRVGTEVAVLVGMGVSVGGTGVLAGGSGVLVGGTTLFVAVSVDVEVFVADGVNVGVGLRQLPVTLRVTNGKVGVL
jgi:hypothetical protein